MDYAREKLKECYPIKQLCVLFGPHRSRYYADANQSITTATILHSNEGSFAQNMLGGSERTLNEMSGWRGDATIKTKDNGWFKDKTVQFGSDDYKADLDAANVTHLMQENDWSFNQATDHYYSEYLGSGNSRAEMFLEHTPYNHVDISVKQGLLLFSSDELKRMQPDAHNFLRSLKDGRNEIKRY